MALASGQVYTVGEVLAEADFDLASEAAVDYNDTGYDVRRVKVGGLGFDSVEDSFRVAGDKVEVSLDGEVVKTLEVENDAADEE
jgi:hypothetical protein